MKPRMLTPGPTPVPEDTMLDLARPVFYHRSAQFRQILADVLADLQYLFCIYACCLNFSLSAIHSQWCWGDYSGQDLPPVQLGGLVFLLGKPTDVVTIRARLCVC